MQLVQEVFPPIKWEAILTEVLGLAISGSNNAETSQLPLTQIDYL